MKIPKSRLEAIPYASLCIQCASQREEGHRPWPPRLTHRFCFVKYVKQVVGIESTGHAFTLRSAFEGFVLAEQAYREATHRSKVYRPLSVLLPSCVLAEGNI